MQATMDKPVSIWLAERIDATLGGRPSERVVKHLDDGGAVRSPTVLLEDEEVRFRGLSYALAQSCMQSAANAKQGLPDDTPPTMVRREAQGLLSRKLADTEEEFHLASEGVAAMPSRVE